MDEWYGAGYEPYERFAVMTVDGGTDDVTALREVQREYGRKTAVRIWWRIKQNEGIHFGQDNGR